MAPVRGDALLDDEAAFAIGDPQGLPAIRIEDRIRGVDGGVAGIVGIGARVQVAQLIGAIRVAESEERLGREVADAAGRGWIGRAIGGIVAEAPHLGVEKSQFGRLGKEIDQGAVGGHADRLALPGRDEIGRGAVTLDNSRLYVTNFGSNSVAVYDIDMGRRLATLTVGSRPDALALTPDQNYLLVLDTQSGDVTVIQKRTPHRTLETSEYSLMTLIPVGVQPNAIVVKAFTASTKK